MSCLGFVISRANRPFQSCFEPHYESEAKCKVYIMQISFHSYANKTYFHMNNFVLSFAFITKLTATRTWPIRSQLPAIFCIVYQVSWRQ